MSLSLKRHDSLDVDLTIAPHRAEIVHTLALGHIHLQHLAESRLMREADPEEATRRPTISGTKSHSISG